MPTHKKLRGRPPVILAAVKQWLIEKIYSPNSTEDGKYHKAVTAREILIDAKAKGIGIITLRRAKKELHIKSVAGRKDGKIIWYWT